MENIINIVVSILAFIAVVLMIEGFYLLWRAIHEEGDAKIQKRLRTLSAGGDHGKEILDLIKNRALSSVPILNRVLMTIPRAHAIDRLLGQAGTRLTVTKLIGLQILLSVLIVLALLKLTPVHTALAVIIAITTGFAAPYIYILRLRKKRQLRFTEQLPDALDYIARSLRAGNPFSASLKSVAGELGDPIGKEFGITFDEMNYGLEIEDALYNLGNRVGCDELHYFITAVLIQRTTGGNLADVLNKISAVMRERARTLREIIIQAAEMRLSARILIALPFIVAGAITIFNPGYLETLFEEPMGRTIIGVQILLMAIGYIVIRRMINFRI
ncbi:type II secretion system F family protein [Sulfuriflexus sp.]|uniref:type II secretion system F family protein n=1 Tax=Sulfuriflexus sp. TaxID=2015443 RepID=UPI0028CCF4DC|nr:type II secretion system F family protein [Sulfuriflexus sp.]MDT8403033.1 type II secretion system F family protein [Sulfuriflexus sp.]